MWKADPYRCIDIDNGGYKDVTGLTISDLDGLYAECPDGYGIQSVYFDKNTNSSQIQFRSTCCLALATEYFDSYPSGFLDIDGTNLFLDLDHGFEYETTQMNFADLSSVKKLQFR